MQWAQYKLIAFLTWTCGDLCRALNTADRNPIIAATHFGFTQSNPFFCGTKWKTSEPYSSTPFNSIKLYHKHLFRSIKLYHKHVQCHNWWWWKYAIVVTRCKVVEKEEHSLRACLVFVSQASVACQASQVGCPATKECWQDCSELSEGGGRVGHHWIGLGPDGVQMLWCRQGLGKGAVFKTRHGNTGKGQVKYLWLVLKSTAYQEEPNRTKVTVVTMPHWWSAAQPWPKISSC